MSERRDVAEPRPPSAPRISRSVPPRTSRSAEARLACLAALVLVPAVLVVLHVVAYPRLSPIDEQMHIDYLSRAPGVQPVVSGTQLGQLAMREEACRGIDSGFMPPPCDSPTLSPAQFELGGYDTAYIHPPTYYSLTAILARGLRSVTGLSSLVTAARLVGALWLATGLLVTYAAGRALGASRAALVGMALLAASLQAVLFFSATVTPDVGSLLVGGLALWLVLLWEKHPSRWWLPPLAGLVAVAIKLQNAAVVLVLVLYLLLGAVRRWRPEGGIIGSARAVAAPAGAAGPRGGSRRGRRRLVGPRRGRCPGGPERAADERARRHPHVPAARSRARAGRLPAANRPRLRPGRPRGRPRAQLRQGHRLGLDRRRGVLGSLRGRGGTAGRRAGRPPPAPWRQAAVWLTSLGPCWSS